MTFKTIAKKLYLEHDSAEYHLSKMNRSFKKIDDSSTETDKYLDGVIQAYQSENNNQPKMKSETPLAKDIEDEEPKPNEEHRLNEELISSLIDKSFSDPDAHHQSIESITDVYFNLLDNHYFKAANHLLEGEIIKAFKPNDELEAKSDEFKQHLLLKIYNFARENLIINDVKASYPALKVLLDNFPPKEGTN